MTPVILPRRCLYLYSDGVTATIPPTPSLRKSGRTYRPSSTAQKHTERSVTTTCCTSRWRGQKINAHYISALQGKLFTPDKEEDGHTRGHLFCFSLSSFPVSSFYHECKSSPTLENYKREGKGHTSLSQHERTHTWLRQHTLSPKRPEIRFLSRKLVTPTMNTPVQANTSSSRIY
jgi:hypothetical protein